MSVTSSSIDEPVTISTVPEELSSNDTISCLYSKESSEKCRIGLTDTILFEAGVPVSWYYTGKTGEILKKRNVEMQTVSQRWLKINTQFDPSNSNNLPRDQPIAIMRQKSGVIKFLSFDAWDQYVCTCKTIPDSSVLSLHCFVKGHDKTFYRNKYTIKDGLGRYITSTQSYLFKSNNITLDTIQVYHERDIQFADSKVTALRNIMDLATNTIIRYMEKMLNIRVLNIAIDYAIDQKSQLWMLWANDVWIVRTTNLLNVINWYNKPINENSRMSWAGLKFEEEFNDMKKDGRVLMNRDMSSVAATGSLTSVSRDINGNIQPQILTNHFTDHTGYKRPITHLEVDQKLVNTTTGSEQVYEAINTITESKTSRNFKAKGNITTTHVMLAANDNKNDNEKNNNNTNNTNNNNNNELNEMDRKNKKSNKIIDNSVLKGYIPNLNLKSKEELAKTSYPDPFKCKGDYCNVIMHAVGPLFMDPEMKKEHGTSLDSFFSKEELLKLQSQPKYSEIIKQHLNNKITLPSNLTNHNNLQIMMKSLILARRERRGVFASNVNRDTWKNYPITPRHEKTLRQHLNELRASGTLPFNEDDSEISMELKLLNARNRNTADNLELNQLAENKQYVDSFTKTLPQYYEQVCVCNNCYHIYHLLDWARETLYQQLNDPNNNNNNNNSNTTSINNNNNNKKKRKSNNDTTTTTNNSINNNNNSKLEFPGPENPEGVPKAIPFKNNNNNNNNNVEKPKSRNNTNRNELQSNKQTTNNTTNNTTNPSLESTDDISRGKVTWKDYSTGPLSKSIIDKNMNNSDNKFSDLDDYLRSGAQSLASKKAREKEHLMRERLSKLQEGSIQTIDPSNKNKLITSKSFEDIYHGKVLFACPESNEFALNVIAYLEESLFEVYWIKDGREATNQLLYRLDKFKYDCLLIDKNIPLDNAVNVTIAVRDHEREARKALAAKLALRGRGDVPKLKRLPVICFTNETTPEDLKHYMKADMDGCVSFPVNKISLLDTIRAAIPHHLAEIQPKLPKVNNRTGKEEEPVDELEEFELMLKNSKANESKAYKLNNLGVMEGSLDSATAASASLPISQATEEDYSINGVVQIDADTRIPYMVLDASKNAKVLVNPKKPFFNVVICHDLFDTAEKMKIFFKPIIEKYLGMQVLVWNYPGQAFTEFRTGQLLNNEYHAICLNELLGQVGSNGTKDFDTDRPFYILGYGFGVSIASFYLSHFRVPNVRGLLSVNGWSFLDSYLAGIMHDCINVFQAAPPSRPDLPVYFFSRFLFCKEYLAKVSVPLALNIYTAIHNPISSIGRLQLCKGVLQTVDMRSVLKELDLPVICVQSTQDSFVRPLHIEPFVKQRNGEVKSIHSALQQIDKTCVIWIKSGHELFQENKKQTQLLFEQILTGFHETHDIQVPTAVEVDKVAVQQGLVTIHSNLVGEKTNNKDKNNKEKDKNKTVEDNYINNILGTVNTITTATSTNRNLTTSNSTTSLPPLNQINQSSMSVTMPALNTNATATSIQYENSMFVNSIESPINSRSNSPNKINKNNRNNNNNKKEIIFNATDPQMWAKYSQTISEGQNLGSINNNNNQLSKNNKNKSKNNKNDTNNNNPDRIFDPTLRAFERQDSVVYNKKDKTTNPSEYEEIKEYMGWRLKRNKKRLQRLQAATKIIQAAYRAHVARMFVQGIRRRKAAMMIQRCFRGWIGRCTFLEQAKRIWAAQRIQRAFRGYLGRKFYFYIRLRIAAAANIQRVFRGYSARVYVDLKRKRRYYAACKIQSLFRRNHARKIAFRRRYEKNSSICIQRIFRGHLGKKKALAERDKFIFSRSQTQGIEFGRQMLLEHKLHATRLQSDVTLLMQEKVAAEEMVEALLDEISSFEGGVRTLEKEMHQLSKVESEAAAYMDEESKYELREQKIRLDKEFGDMLAKIANRKDMLTDLEKKLNVIDKSRQGKEEELRTLERKLVVLLEEQQNELNAIKRKQDIRGAMLAASHTEIMNASANNNNNNNSQALVVAGNNGSSNTNNKLGAVGGGNSGPSLQEKKQAAQLMQSTETLMKFGFMSMSMTYFSSLNMIKALRTVSAQDTVMAALADVHSQRAMGMIEGVNNSNNNEKVTRGPHLPDLKKGQLPGQEQLRVSAWSVDDVAKWLQTLSLGQYCEAFIDAAIDGDFLYDINDDDLKNTLGIEHRLHRKKILNCVYRLKVAEAQEDSRLSELLKATNNLEQQKLQDDMEKGTDGNPFTNKPALEGSALSGASGNDRRIMDGPKIPLPELFSLVRHSKFSLIKEALDYLPNKKFDKSLVQSPYITDHGTVYVSGYENLTFHTNKTDEEFGNTMLMLACQNGNHKLVKYLIAKGANPSAQNKAGQTPAHFAIAFKFYDVSKWLFENGADDTITNKYGLTPYDGLLPEGVSGTGNDMLQLED